MTTLVRLLLLSMGLGLAASAYPDDGIVNREYQLKTAYLFHFAELTEWPDSPATVTICSQGSTPIRDYLPILEGRQAHDRIVHVLQGDALAIEQCRILLLGETEELSRALLEKARSRHVLLISDSEDFARNGGMIQFTLRDNRLKLVINLTSVRQAGLKLSSKLLRMAEILE